MAETFTRRVARALDRNIRGRAYGVTRLADQMGVAPRTIDRWCADETALSAADLLRLVSCVAAEDPARANALLDDLLGIAGFAAHRAPAPAPQLGDAREEAADEAAADLQHEVRDATRDGAIDAEEGARIRNAARRVQPRDGGSAERRRGARDARGVAGHRDRVMPDHLDTRGVPPFARAALAHRPTAPAPRDPDPDERVKRGFRLGVEAAARHIVRVGNDCAANGDDFDYHEVAADVRALARPADPAKETP
jgi:hypothetical protein